MTDKEKLIYVAKYVANECGLDSIEDILDYFFSSFENDISAIRMHNLINKLNYHLGRKIKKLEHARYVANERAHYLKFYLNGDMWTTEEAARENIQPQIDNAQAIIDACKR